MLLSLGLRLILPIRIENGSQLLVQIVRVDILIHDLCVSFLLGYFTGVVSDRFERKQRRPKIERFSQYGCIALGYEQTDFLVGK